MILNETKPHSETFNVLDERFFSIADKGMIFDILRSKMYSNPILAIAREISCNALDAHREVGKFDEPIIIHLPTGLQPEFKIIDHGPGISPDRIENIFIKYAASTKRDTNVLMGAMGLGSKTPFSYADSFSVITTHNGIKYHYACYIDETKVGKIACLAKVSTDENNGTEISIPVKSSDFDLFKQYTQQACQHWLVKPQIIGPEIKWEPLPKTLEGSNWFISNLDGSSYRSNAPKLIIDSIEYPLDLTALKKYADTKLIDAIRGTLYLIFGNGELTLSTNRENIFLDKSTQEKICLRLEEVANEIKQQVQNKIDAYSNLWDANAYFFKGLTYIFNSLSFVAPLCWQGHKLSTTYTLNIKCPVFLFQKGKYSYRRGNDPDKITRSFGNDLEFAEHSILFVNDLSIKDPTPKHVKKAFDNDPNLKYVQVICPTDKRTEADLNKEINLDKMDPKRLSSITKAVGRKYTPSANRLLVFKSDSGGNFRQVSYDEMDKDTNDKVLGLLVRNAYSSIRDVILSNKQKLNNLIIEQLMSKFPDTSFYGVDMETEPKRIKDDLSDLVPLEKFLDRNLLNKTINYTEIKYVSEQLRETDDRLLHHLDKLEKLIINKDSPFLARLHLHRKIVKLSKEENGSLWLYEAVKGTISADTLNQFGKDHPELNVSEVNKKYHDRYPLFGIMNCYYIENALKHIAQYVNLIDKN